MPSATASSIETSPVPVNASVRNPSDRLTSLDLFRGITIAAMILVNDPGNDHAYRPLEHAQWNGWTPTDLIFPFFLFIVGVSMVFSFQSRLSRGDSRELLLRHALRRGLIIFAIGLALNCMRLLAGSNAGVRIPGVLQRIGICYTAASVLFLYVRPKGRAVWVAGLLIGYWILMRFFPVPGFGVPGRNMPFFDPDANLGAYLDRKFLLWGSTRLYEVTRDPEGLLSTLPAIGTALLGVFTGEWLRSGRSQKSKALGMVAVGIAGLLLGELWGVWFPINKKLWTSSYVLFAAGFALLCLALVYWINDIKRWRGSWTKPLLIFGRNSITVYIFAWLLAESLDAVKTSWKGESLSAHDYIFQRFFAPLGSPSFSSLLFSLAFVLVCLLPIWLMDHKKIFLKI